MEANTICNVKNRSASLVVYRIPEKGIRREFAPGETKKIAYQELLDLSYQPGGRALMANFLQIQAQEVIEELNVPTDVEYNFSEQDVANLIKNGSLDEFLDCLDFAPVGVLDLLKAMCVQLPLTDMAKRQALKEKTGFDIDKAIAMDQADKADEKAEGAEPATGRRVKPAAAETTTPGRRSGGYKIISQPADTTTEEE